MSLGLGIDTGGTYTDLVIYDFDHKEVINSTKAKTSREDLKIGILAGLNKFPVDQLKKIEVVSLSTTLATNAAVEDRTASGKLILIGCDREVVQKYGSEYGLPPSDEIVFLEGGHNQQGDVLAEPDWQILNTEIDQLKNSTDGFAVVQLWGMRNPEFETKAKKLIKEWTGLPVVCAHELLGDLNFLKRAATAYLNVKLIPIINDFLDAIKDGLHEKGINAPLVIVRGDGSLMTEAYAREKPLETLLSGPAASVIGGMNLTGKKNCIILDMGGTTSDFALVKNGQLNLVNGGIDVGNWRTGTKSIALNTIGLGGDSRIFFNNNGDIKIGPNRVAPLSWLVNNWPDLIEDLCLAVDLEDSLIEYYYLYRDNEKIGVNLYQREKDILEVLQVGPQTLNGIADKLDCSIFDLNLKRLEHTGLIFRSGLTPTDIMHLTGNYTPWNIEAARFGAEKMAELLNVSVSELINKVEKTMKRELYYSLVKMLLEEERDFKPKHKLEDNYREMILFGYPEKPKNTSPLIKIDFDTDLSLIGIGAPVHIYLPDVARVLNTDCIIPEKAAVANAIGAITGNVNLEEEVKIRPRYQATMISGYDCYSTMGKKEFKQYDKALTWAKEEAVKLAREKAVERGAVEVEIEIKINNKDVTPGIGSSNSNNKKTKKQSESSLLLETQVIARAVGKIGEIKGITDQPIRV